MSDAMIGAIGLAAVGVLGYLATMAATHPRTFGRVTGSIGVVMFTLMIFWAGWNFGSLRTSIVIRDSKAFDVDAVKLDKIAATAQFSWWWIGGIIGLAAYFSIVEWIARSLRQESMARDQKNAIRKRVAGENE